jgi:hypothetical protein
MLTRAERGVIHEMSHPLVIEKIHIYGGREDIP